MPDISLPEVRLKDKLPEGLRDMTMEDIQHALPEVHLPKLELGREARRVRKDAEKAVARAAREADRTARDAQKAAAREAARAAKSIEQSLPGRRRGPNLVPIAIVMMLGGLVVGWILANSPATGPRISAWLDRLGARWNEWRGGRLEDGWDSEPQAYTDALRSPIEPEPFTGTLPESETGVGVGPGRLAEGIGTSEPTPVASDNRH